MIIKSFKVGWVGSQDFKIIQAKNEKEAKRKFADIEGVNVSSYIQVRRK